MWFRFPEGTTGINVQLHEYTPEARDADGRDCFRAPEHFAPFILDLPGFGVANPETDLPDLPKADPERDGALFRISGQVDALKLEVENLRATLAETRTERDEFKLKFMNAEAEVSQLKEEAEGISVESKALPRK